MTKYMVTIHQTVYQRSTMIVDAESQREAEAACRSLVFNGDDAKVGWFVTESDTDFDVEEDDRDRDVDISASDFDDLDEWIEDCADPDDTSREDSIAEWMKKRWRVDLHPKTGVVADVSNLARDLSHTDAVKLMTEHNDGPYPTWARMKEDADAEA